MHRDRRGRGAADRGRDRHPPAQGGAARGARSCASRPAGVVETGLELQRGHRLLAPLAGRPLWVGTGLEGKLYRYADTQMLLEKDVDERQIVALLPGAAGPAFATTNAAAFYRITAGTEKSAAPTPAPPWTPARSPASAPSAGAARRRRGAASASPSAAASSAEPDRTWSAWTAAPRRATRSSLAGVPRGRYVQWRAELRAGERGARRRLYGDRALLPPGEPERHDRRPRRRSTPGRSWCRQLQPDQPGLRAGPPQPRGDLHHPGAPARTTTAAAASSRSGRQGYRTLRWSAGRPQRATSSPTSSPSAPRRATAARRRG